jgi:hypothetical protein
LEQRVISAQQPAAVMAAANCMIMSLSRLSRLMAIEGVQVGLLALPNWRENKHLFCVGFVVRISKFATQRRRNNFLFT